MEITVNGKREDVAEGTCIFQLKQEADVVIYNGYQVPEDLPLQPGDRVVLIQKGVMPQKEELEEMMAARHTPNVHEKMKKAKVAIAGLGGLGSNVALLLARMGVGELFLVDFDVVEPSNLNRQAYFISQLGMEKTKAMEDLIAQVNPYLTVKTAQVKVQEENAAKLFAGYPIVCEAFDDPVAKALLVNTLLDRCPKTKIVAASGMAGLGSANAIRTRQVFSNLYLCGDETAEAGPGQGLMAPRVAVCAAHQANLIVRLILEA